MPLQVCSGAMMKCSCGTQPAPLMVLPQNRVQVNNQPAANIMDYIPVVNIPSFGMCITQANPSVASATAAAQGVLTPMPCVPVTTSPWSPGEPDVMIGNQPALDDISNLMCQWTGVITFVDAGEATVNVP